MTPFKARVIALLKASERYTKTDMVYLAQSGFWLNANYTLVAICSFLLSIAFANLLTKAEYGVYQYLLTAAAFLTAFTFTGMNTAVTRAVSQGEESAVRSSVRIQLLWNMIPAAAALLGAGYYFLKGAPVLSFGFLCIGLSLPLINAFNTYSAYLTGTKRFRKLSLYLIASNLFYYLLIFSTTILFPSASVLILVNLAASTFSTLAIYFHICRHYHLPDGKAKGIVSYARHLSAMNVLTTIAQHVDKLLVFQLLGARELATYALATLLPERIAGSFKPIFTSAFPRFAEQKTAHTIASLGYKLALLVGGTLLVAIAYALVAPKLFSLFYPQYLDAIPFSQVYALTFVSAAGHLVLTAFQAQHQLKKLYVINTVVPLMQITLLCGGIYFGGLWGLVAAKVVSSVLFGTVALLLLGSSGKPA